MQRTFHASLTFALSCLITSNAWSQTDYLYQVDGYKTGMRFGAAISGVGDVNKDGYDDFAIGSPFEDKSGPAYVPNTGRVRVISGKDGTMLGMWNGESANDHFGWSVAGLGDVDHDNFPDILGGIPDWDDPGQNTSGTGLTRIHSGKDGHVFLNLVAIGNMDGCGYHDQLGFSASAIGDVSGDSYPDFVVGAPQSARNKPLNGCGGVFVPNPHVSGYARVYSGNPNNPSLVTLYQFLGGSDYEQFGFSVCGAGDVDGDGRPDIIVGAPQYNIDCSGTPGPCIGITPYITGPGYAKIFSGRTGALIRTLNGDAGGDAFGFAVAGVGDIDQDGFDDVIVGSPNWNGKTGRAVVYSGKDGTVLFLQTASGPCAGPCFFGSSVAGLGDLNHDGFEDYAVGAARQGDVYVYSGKDHALIYMICTDINSPQYIANSVLPALPVAAVGDMNADGWRDLVVGFDYYDQPAPPMGSGLTDVGQVRVYSTFPKFVSEYGTGTPGCTGEHTLTALNTPKIGTPFRAMTYNAPQAMGSSWWIGDTKDGNGSDPFGIGLLVHLNLSTITQFYEFRVANGNSCGTQCNVDIPNDPNLVGSTYYMQAFFLWPTNSCPNLPLGQMSSSKGLEFTIQP